MEKNLYCLIYHLRRKSLIDSNLYMNIHKQFLKTNTVFQEILNEQKSMAKIYHIWYEVCYFQLYVFCVSTYVNDNGITWGLMLSQMTVYWIFLLHSYSTKHSLPITMRSQESCGVSNHWQLDGVQELFQAKSNTIAYIHIYAIIYIRASNAEFIMFSFELSKHACRRRDSLWNNP